MNAPHSRTRLASSFFVAILLFAVTACSSSVDRVETNSPTTDEPTTTSPTSVAPPTTLLPIMDSNDPISEAPTIPFLECGLSAEPGPPVGAELDRLQQLRDSLEADGLQQQPHVRGWSGPTNVWGTLSVMLSRRDQETIDWLAERVAPADLCLDLPPVGYYDRPYEAAVWEIKPEPGPSGNQERQITLLVDTAAKPCDFGTEGRVLEPIIVYAPDTVEITIPLEHIEWGPVDLVCFDHPPTEYELVLTEDLAGRELVEGAPPS